ncbi:MAG: hypothetical protein PSV13_12405 [Lacunisphaera sp.]|nr:hypothetical protein [Lacunisphaera sp.]
MSADSAPAVAFTPRRWLLVLLLVSAAARLGLAAAGGQYFMGDESRYQTGVAIYQALRAGDWAGVGAQLMRPEHAAFNYLNTVVAALQHGLAQFTAWADWSQAQNPYASAHLAAAVLALFPVLNIWLVHRLARIAGAGEAEAGWVALLMAASNTLFYYSRHLLPYDCALSAALGGLVFAVAGGPRAAWKSGGGAALAYQLYNGYWFLVPVIFLAQQLAQPAGPARWRAGADWVAGCLGATLLLMLPGLAFGGSGYWSVMQGFSGSVTQGLFREGWSLAGEYLWHSEGWLGVAVLLGAGFALGQTLRPGADAGRVRRWGLLLLAGWLLPVLASTGLHQFVVYARTVRPLVPLLCLLGGFGLHQLAADRPRWRSVLAGLVVAAALFNLAPHFRRVFPREFESQVLGEYGMPKRWITFTGSIYKPRFVPVRRPDLVLVNTQYLYPLRGYRGFPPGDVLRSREHPLSYRPYQYEGHVPRERRLLRDHPPAMQLVRPTRTELIPDHPPPASNFTEADRPDGRDRGRAQ